jgi:hypothetical protein
MPSSPSNVLDEEVHRIVDLEHELAMALPDVDEVTVRQTVGRIWTTFRNAKVRDYVPLLVRRQALAELRGSILPSPRAPQEL